MRTLSIIAASAALLATAATSPLIAQQTGSSAAPSSHRLRWGPQITYDFNDDNLGGGARLEYSLAGLLGTPNISGMFEGNWFPGTIDAFDLTYNVAYRFQTPSLRPYAGGGLGLWVLSGGGATDTQLKLNAVGGLQFAPMGRVTPIIQLRYVFVRGEALLLTGGILF